MSVTSRSRRETLAPRVVLLVLFVLYAAPLLTLVVTSLQGQGTLPSLSPHALLHPSVSAFTEVIHAGAWRSLRNGLIVATGVTAVVLFLGVPGAYWFARAAPRAGGLILLVLVFLQMIPTASSVIPLFPVMTSWGLVNHLYGLILASAGSLLPFAILLLGPFFAAVPESLYEAAAVDGAGQVDQFVRLGVPLIRNGLTTVGVLTFMIAWGEFVYAINFLSGPSQYPASALITQFLLPYRTDWPGLMAASLIAAFPVIVIFLIFQRRLAFGLASGAGKG